MSKTGTYKYDAKTGEMVKVSDRASAPASVFWRDGCDHSGMYHEHLGKRFTSKARKREYLQKNQIVEAG